MAAKARSIPVYSCCPAMLSCCIVRPSCLLVHCASCLLQDCIIHITCSHVRAARLFKAREPPHTGWMPQRNGCALAINHKVCSWIFPHRTQSAAPHAVLKRKHSHIGPGPRTCPCCDCILHIICQHWTPVPAGYGQLPQRPKPARLGAWPLKFLHNNPCP